MRNILLCAASLVIGLVALGFTVSETAAQEKPKAPPKKIDPKTTVKVVYHSREHHKRFDTKNEAELFAKRLRTLGFQVEVRQHGGGDEPHYRVNYELRQERTKLFTGPQALANANALVSFLRSIHVDARVVNKK